MSLRSLGDSAQLPVLHEQQLPQTHSHDTDLAAFCDIHELLAIALSNANSGSVVVYRLTGQVAFKIEQRNDDDNGTVSAMKWKPDGSVLGIGWSSGACGLYSGENGKLLNYISATEESADDDFGNKHIENQDGSSLTTCIGWTSHVSVTKNAISAIDNAATELDMETNNQPRDSTGRYNIAGLATAIKAIDITKNMPRLSAIPSHNTHWSAYATKFSTQADTDAVFNEREKLASTSIDTLVTAASSGHATVHLDDSVKIGGFQTIHNEGPVKAGGASVLHASNALLACEVLLSTEDDGYSLHHIDLPLEQLSGSLLQVIALNTRRTQELVDYVKQTVDCMVRDIDTCFRSPTSVPTRLTKTMANELSEKDEGDLSTNLYHLAMTGSFTPTMLELLSDIIKDTNHKRWDQAVNTMYTSVQNHIFENLLPSLERLSIAASVIRGHARLHEESGKFISPKTIDVLLDDIDALRIMAQKVQLTVLTEHRQFGAFSKWLKLMIEVAIAGPGTKGALETEEREIPNLEYGLVLEYIKGTLLESMLVKQTDRQIGSKFEREIAELVNRNNTIRALELLESHPEGQKNTISLPILSMKVAYQNRLLVDEITKWQSSMLPAPQTTDLSNNLDAKLDAASEVLDLRIFPSENSGTRSVTKVLSSPSRQERPNNELCLLTCTRNDSDKTCSLSSPSYYVLDVGIIHAQFIDQSQCLVVCDEALLLCNLANYDPDHPWQWVQRLSVFGPDSESPDFRPNRIVVGGRPGKEVCIVFEGSGAGSWKVLDLSGISSL